MTVTKSDLLEAIRHYGVAVPRRPEGSGWETVAQMAKREKVTKSTLRYRFDRAIANGLKIERFVGSDYDHTGTLVKQTWFRVKP